MTSYRDGFGNWCTRILAPAGRLRLSASALLNDTGEPDPIARSEQQHAVEDLPEESLVFLLGSRYCETDRLTGIAWDLFGKAPTGAGRVHAICDYVHRHIAFSYQDARSTRTAWEALQEGKGVCRDYAHLAIAFCRCMNIPARYCTGYLGDIGIPPPYGADGFCRLVRGLYRRTLAHVRCAEQHRRGSAACSSPVDAMRRMWRSATRSVPTRSRVSRSGPTRSAALSTKQESVIRPESHAPPDRAARHDLPIFGTGEIWRASHDVSATRESRSPARQHEAGYPAAPVGSSLASRRLRQFGGHRHV